MTQTRLIVGVLVVALALPTHGWLAESRSASSMAPAVFTEQTLTLRGDVFRFNRFTRTPAIAVLGLIPGTRAAEELNQGIAEGRPELIKKALLNDCPFDELKYVVGAYNLEEGILPEVMLQAFRLLKIHHRQVGLAASRALADVHALWFRLRDDFVARHTKVFDLTMAQWFHPTEGHRQEVGQLFNAMFLEMLINLHRLIDQDILRIVDVTAILQNITEVHRNSHRFYLPRLIAA